ncbi:hypothetical protein [Nocardia puris]|uniref:hypothetical protein n=1 Tax=Nocardia puris TaxID=208602 RepID=UPI001E29DFC5|nr:hypothetical protein [Nocardia puris]
MTFSLLAALIMAGAVFVLLAKIRGIGFSIGPFDFDGPRPSSGELYDLVRSAVPIAALAAGVFAAVYAYRKQRVDEAASHRADAEHLSSRYQGAAEQLGDDKAAVRLAGVYALARLADDWPEQRQTCIDVLCAYYRMHVDTDALTSSEQQVRETILSSILERLGHQSAPSWRGYSFDLRRSYFNTELRFTAGIGDTFIDATGAIFDGCELILSVPALDDLGVLALDKAIFKNDAKVEISGWLRTGVISFKDAQLLESRFDFTGVVIDGGRIDFYETQFVTASAFFSGAHFHAGETRFDRAIFRGGEVFFDYAQFRPGVVSFGYASFEGTAFTFEDSEGEKPAGLPASQWRP